MNYQTANEKLTGRNQERRKLENNTYLERRGEDIAVRLHNTDIILFRPNGETVLYAGGWRTVTTKDRINRYAPVNIGQRDGQWFLMKYNKTGWEDICLFADGITIGKRGGIKGALPLRKADSQLKLRKQVRKYAADYMKAFVEGKVPAPGPGDCWYCFFRETKGEGTMHGTLQPDGKLTNTATVSPNGDGRTMGEISGDKDHILSHIKEKYYVPSLLARAFAVMPHSTAMGWALADKWSPNASPKGAGMDFVLKQLQTNLSRYILRQLGQAA